MTFHPPYPTESWCVSLTQAVGRVSQFDCFVNKCDIESVQRAQKGATRTQCQSSLILDSSSQPAQGALNTHLTPCDRWRWSLTILPTSPNKVGGTFLLPVEPLMYEFVSGSKLTLGTGSLRNRTCRAGLRQCVGARNKDMPAHGYTVAIPLSRYSINLVSDAHAGGFALLCTSPMLVFKRLYLGCPKVYDHLRD